MSDQRRNIEIKARCYDLLRVERAAVELGAQPKGVLEQVDTYFHVSNGRLKLRETKGCPAELIFYRRIDSDGLLDCAYYVLPIPQPLDTKAALGAAVGIRGEVRKRRTLYLWKNVRIHLDEVDDLGSLIELEAVMGGAENEEVSRMHLGTLVQAMGIRLEDRTSQSNVDLLGF
jgi:adenylate cyclase class IV